MPIDPDDENKVSEVLGKLDRDEFAEIGKMRKTASDMFDIKKLFCYGCSHCASDGKFPGGPSGERPCFFCVRNPDREKWQKDFKKRHGHELKQWYDGSPICFYPMDAYTPIDMQEQMDRWERRAKGESTWNEPKGGVRFG